MKAHIILLLILLAPSAAAGFGKTYTAYSEHEAQAPLGAEGTITFTRPFQITNDTAVYAFLNAQGAQLVQGGYRVDVSVGQSNSHGGLSETWFSRVGVNDTEPFGYHVMDAELTGLLQVTVHHPSAQDQGAVHLRVVVALDERVEGEGNGGVLNPSIATTLRLDFVAHQQDEDEHGPATTSHGPREGAADLDADGLPDSWERSHFGSIWSHTGSDDPDRDGCDNATEHARGTDPNAADCQAGNPQGPQGPIIILQPAPTTDASLMAYILGFTALCLLFILVGVALRRPRRRQRKRPRGAGMWIDGIRQDDAEVHGWAGARATRTDAPGEARHRAKQSRAEVGPDGEADIPIS